MLGLKLVLYRLETSGNRLGQAGVAEDLRTIASPVSAVRSLFRLQLANTSPVSVVYFDCVPRGLEHSLGLESRPSSSGGRIQDLAVQIPTGVSERVQSTIVTMANQLRTAKRN